MHIYKLTVPIKPVCFTILLGLFCLHGMAETGDGLVINGSRVNLRAEPPIIAKIRLQLDRGDEVIEISRYEEWVEVATKRNDVESGWIHGSLLMLPENNSDEPDEERLAFNEFSMEFEKLMNSSYPISSEKLFSEVQHLQHGNIRIMATEYWFKLQQDERDRLLTEVFNLWRRWVIPGYSVMVEIVDKHNQQHMMILK